MTDPLVALKAQLVEALRLAIDDAALTVTGRSLGDIGSERVTEMALTDVWPLLVAALDAAEARGREKLEELRADSHHNLNSAIGLIQLWADPGFDFSVTVERAEDVVSRLHNVTDAMDAALGEKPLREQLDEMKAELAAARGRSVSSPTPQEKRLGG